MSDKSKLFGFLLATVLCVPVHADGGGYTQNDNVIRTADGVPVGESTLIRTENRINVVMRTSDLDPGAAMTVWWRIYNRPNQ